MPRQQYRLALVLAALRPATAAGQSTTRAVYVARLGVDTIALERFTLSGPTLSGVTMSRNGTTIRLDYRMTFRPDGSVAEADWTARPVHGAVDTGGVPDLPWGGHLEALVQRLGPALGDSASWQLMYPDPSRPIETWATTWQFVRARADSVLLHRPGVPILEFGLVGPDRRPVRWRVLRSQYEVTREPDRDIEPAIASFFDRDRANGGLGTLSPRDTVRLVHEGASFLVDYGRPSRRGRPILGGVVGYDAVWRTGANLATHVRLSRPVRLQGVMIPAGLHTLWTVPSRTGWTLVVNEETGQWGLDYHQARDLVRVPMRQEVLPEPREQFTIRLVPRGRVVELRLEWDTWAAVADLEPEP